MEHQDQSVSTILDRSGRCQSRMFTAPPLWLCRGLPLRGNCKCHRTGLRCSTLCKCEGGCTNNDNKAIRDGKYLALPHSSAWRRPPIKIENFDNFFVMSFLCSLEFLYFLLIELPKKLRYKIFERNCRSSL